MKIRYIVSMSGSEKSYPAFEKDKTGEWVYHEVDDLQAIRMVQLERAVPKNQKEFETAKANIEKLEAEKQAKLELAENIKNLDEMKQREVALKEELKELTAKIKATELAVKGK